jgi:dynein heavy chain
MYVKLGDKDVEYNKNFKLFLHTKLSNPHYPPEIQAETTLINFTVTEQVRSCLDSTVQLVCKLTLY